MPPVTIHAEDTPNPQAYKFTADRPFPPAADPGKFRSYRSPGEADTAQDPLAQALFALGPVVSVMIVNDFVTVNKKPSARWPKLRPKIEAILLQHLHG